MMPFVIQSTTTWISKKTGKEVSSISYFKYHNTQVLAFNSMEGSWEKAKIYDFSTEAHRDKRKYFAGSSGVKVVNTKTLAAHAN